MADEVVRIHLKDPDLLVVGVSCAATAQRARAIHGCMPTSAALLAEGLVAGFGFAGLLAGQARINLQLTCDGPVQGLFVDADATGRGRGYVKNPLVNFLDSGGPFEPSGALGREGMLSIIRELKAGEFFRGSIALDRFDLAADLERFYRESEQIETAVRLDVRADGAEPLAQVSGLFIQAMPGASAGAVARAGAFADLARPADRARDLVQPIVDGFGGEADVLAQYPLTYVCGCSAEKVLGAVAAMGREEVQDLLDREGCARASCAFCRTTYQIPGDQLQQLLAAWDQGRQDADGKPN